MDDNNYAGKLPNLHKITLGEFYSQASVDGNFQNLAHLDTVVFWGTDVMSVYWNFQISFWNAPSNTKVIVPCGTKQQFLDFWSNDGDFSNTWTADNFEAAECLNTLTVLSSDIALGNAISLSGSNLLTTTTPNNTSVTFSGTATLYATAKANKVFTGWADGNTDNPRTVTVSSDTTFTATFATCESLDIDEVKSASAPSNVFPNPTNNILNVQLEEFVSNGTLTLFDMNGKVVLSQSVSGTSAQINLSALSAGNYVLRLVENGKASVGV